MRQRHKYGHHYKMVSLAQNCLIELHGFAQCPVDIYVFFIDCLMCSMTLYILFKLLRPTYKYKMWFQNTKNMIATCNKEAI